MSRNARPSWAVLTGAMSMALMLAAASCGEQGATPIHEAEIEDPLIRVAGVGWRLLADELAGEPYRTGIATDEAQYEQLWADVGMSGGAPSVDFTDEVVVWFGAVYGSGCPVQLEGVVLGEDVVGDDRPLIHGIIVERDNPTACNDDANPHAFLVAVERTALPTGPFAIQLAGEEPPRGVPEERTLVDVDLSQPGAIAGPDDIGPDPELIAAAGQDPVLTSGAIIEPGQPVRYQLYVHCGVEVLGMVNDTWWQTDEGGEASDYIPDAWRDLVTNEETIEVEIVLSDGESPGITATANGHSVSYLSADESDVPGCD